MALLGTVNAVFRYWFNVRLGTGLPATGVALGDFTVTVRNPANSATMAAPTVVEVSGGLYYFDISASFSNTHGAGEYGVTVAVVSASPAVQDVGGEQVDFTAASLDTIASDVWDEAKAGHVAAGSFGEEVQAHATQAEILSDATPFAGANVDAAVSTRATQAQILSDATPFAGANIDAAISSRAVAGDAMALTAAASLALVDAVWDENIVAAHGTADSAGLVLRALGALISQRTNNANLNALLGVPDTAGQDVPSAVDTELTGTHGAGAWTSASSTDWSATEREQIRSRLGLDGTQTVPTTTIGTLKLVEQILRNRLVLTPGLAGNWKLYADDNTTVLLTWNVQDGFDGPIANEVGVPSQRTARGT